MTIGESRHPLGGTWNRYHEEEVHKVQSPGHGDRGPMTLAEKKEITSPTPFPIFEVPVHIPGLFSGASYLSIIVPVDY